MFSVSMVTDTNLTPAGSSPSSLAVVNGTLFFTANDGTGGQQLWKSDGTAAGTELVKTITGTVAASSISNLVAYHDKVYFFGGYQSGTSALYCSDGTAAGTVLVKDLLPGFSASPPTSIVVANDTLFMSVYGAVFTSDGTTAGTAPLTATGATNLSVGANGLAYFSTSSSSTGVELWRSDGTPGGTFMLRDINPGTAGSTPSAVAAYNNKTYFAANDGSHGAELWVTDGTPSGTSLLADIAAGATGSSPATLVAGPGGVYFTANDGSHGAELWRTDGTTTAMVADINVGAGGSAPASLYAFGGMVYFSATDGSSGAEPWRTNGMAGGTLRLGDVNAGTAGSNPSKFTGVNTTVFFTANDGADGTELWATDGTALGTHLVKDIYTGTGSSVPSSPVAYNGKLFFSAANVANSTELWQSDGAGPNTAMVKDINPGTGGALASNASLASVGNVLYYAASDGATGFELYTSDGTRAGSNLLKDINPGSASSSPTAFTAFGGIVYFSANNGTNGAELWRSNGTPDGTYLLRDINPGAAGSSPANFTVVGNKLYFTANDGVHGVELWVTDGTPSGTSLVMDINPGSASSSPQGLVALGGALYFAANDGSHGAELWQSNDSTTSLVRDINPGTPSSFGSVSYMTVFNGALYFAANDGTHGTELWTSTGLSAGTQLVKDVTAGSAGSSVSYLNVAGGKLFFVATDGTHGLELWATDGSGPNTSMVADINPGAGNAIGYPVLAPAFASVGDKLVFIATDGVHGPEPFVSNGTPEGTFMLKDTNPAPLIGVALTGVFLSSFTTVNGVVYFASSDVHTSPTLNDDSHGMELWRTDGTSAGTWMVSDIFPGSGSALSTTPMANVQGKLYFAAADPVHGSELWVAWQPVDGDIYSNDFSSTANPAAYPNAQWQFDTPDPAQSGGVAVSGIDDRFLDRTTLNQRQFLGQFYNNTVSLSLAKLPAHTSLTLSFDLFILQSMDGSHNEGPEFIQVDYDGGPVLFRSTFSNEFDDLGFAQGFRQTWGDTDASHTPVVWDEATGQFKNVFRGQTTVADFRGETGADETQTLLRFTSLPSWMFNSSVYHVTLTIPDHTADSIRFNFSGIGMQDAHQHQEPELTLDETWGLDNVTVSSASSDVASVDLQLNPARSSDLPADTAEDAVPTPVPVSPAARQPAALVLRGPAGDAGTATLSWDETGGLQIWRHNTDGSDTPIHSGDSISVLLDASGSQRIDLEVAGSAASETALPIHAQFLLADAAVAATDVALANPFVVDLDVDSANVSGAGLRDGTDQAGQGEDSSTLPGKILPVGNIGWSDNGDGTFAAPDPVDTHSATGRMAPVVLQWNPSLAAGATVTFSYSGNDPSDAGAVGGHLRIWLEKVDDSLDPSARFLYLQPGTSYPLTELVTIANAQTVHWQIFVEGYAATTAAFDDGKIVATIKDAVGTTLGSDTVHVTVAGGTTVTFDTDTSLNASVNVADGSVALSWTPSTDANVIGYRIYRSSNRAEQSSFADFDVQDASVIFAVNDRLASAYTDWTTRQDAIYYYRIAEIRKVPAADFPYATEGDYQTTPTDQVGLRERLRAYGSPQAAEDFTAVSTPGGNLLTWSNPNTGGQDDGVEIERSTDGHTWERHYIVGSGLTSYLDPTHQEYHYRIRFHSGESNVSGYTALDDAPFESVVATEVAATSTTVTLQWTAADEYGRDGFHVYRGDSEDFTPDAGSLVGTVHTGSPTPTRFVDHDLTPGTTYFYIVRAYGFDGVEAFRPSETTVAGTTPSAPTSVQPTTSSTTTITLNWTGSSASNLAGYYVYYSTSSPVTSATATRFATQFSGTSGTVTGLTANTQYYFAVTAVGVVESPDFESDPLEFESEMSATSAGWWTAPLAPASVSQDTAATTETSIPISWASSVGANGYILLQTGSWGSWPVYSGAGTSTTDDGGGGGLSPGWTYTYQVVAVNSPYGQSDPSATYSFDTRPQMLQPSYSVALAVTATRVDLAWDEANADLTDLTYSVYRSTTDDFSTAGPPIRSGIPVTSYSDTSAPSDSQVYYWITATRHSLESAPISDSADTSNIPVPETPYDLYATTQPTKEVALHWSAVRAANRYKLVRTGDGTPVTIQVGEVTSYTDTVPTADITYTYQIYAGNDGGYSSDGALASVRMPAAPVQPTITSAVATSPNQIDVTWSHPANATHFIVYHWKDGDDPSTAPGVPVGNSTSWSDTGLIPGATYSYSVVAFGDGGASPASTNTSAPTWAPATLGTFNDVVTDAAGTYVDLDDPEDSYLVPAVTSLGRVTGVAIQPWEFDADPYLWGVDYSATANADGSVLLSFASEGDYLVRITRQSTNFDGSLNTSTEFVEVLYDIDLANCEPLIGDTVSSKVCSPASLPTTDLVIIDDDPNDVVFQRAKQYFGVQWGENWVTASDVYDAIDEINDAYWQAGGVPLDIFILGHGKPGGIAVGGDRTPGPGQDLAYDAFGPMPELDDFVLGTQGELNSVFFLGCRTGCGTPGEELRSYVADGTGAVVSSFANYTTFVQRRTNSPVCYFATVGTPVVHTTYPS